MGFSDFQKYRWRSSDDRLHRIGYISGPFDENWIVSSHRIYGRYFSSECVADRSISQSMVRINWPNDQTIHTWDPEYCSFNPFVWCVRLSSFRSIRLINCSEVEVWVVEWARFEKLQYFEFHIRSWVVERSIYCNTKSSPLIPEYFDYATGISRALKSMASEPYNMTLKLQGPAGLFKQFDKHELCWGMLHRCNANIRECPIDILTYHRKGVTSANDILDNTLKLVETISKLYPKLSHLPYANTEADPSSGWSKPIDAYADVRYANTLISIVLQHWNALWREDLSRFDSLSHDNAFLSYHPFEFQQRTLLARFRMNQSKPITTEFIQKPVYAALGLLGQLASHATKVFTTRNMTYVVTLGERYAAVLLISSSVAPITAPVRLKLNVSEFVGAAPNTTSFSYIVEHLQPNRTDPFAVWKEHAWPSYPNESTLAAMYHAQGPHILKNPRQIPHARPSIFINAKLMSPWILLVRICSSTINRPQKVENLRIRSISAVKILLTWADGRDSTTETRERCVRSYEIFHARDNNEIPAPLEQKHPHNNWINISTGRYIPFPSFQHSLPANDATHASLHGLYKVRAVDIFNRKGPFSHPHRFWTVIEPFVSFNRWNKS